MTISTLSYPMQVRREVTASADFVQEALRTELVTQVERADEAQSQATAAVEKAAAAAEAHAEEVAALKKALADAEQAASEVAAKNDGSAAKSAEAPVANNSTKSDAISGSASDLEAAAAAQKKVVALEAGNKKLIERVATLVSGRV